MIHLTIDTPGAWNTDVNASGVLPAQPGVHLATLRHGGEATVMIRLDLDSGEAVIGECTVKELLDAARSIEAAHGRDGNK